MLPSPLIRAAFACFLTTAALAAEAEFSPSAADDKASQHDFRGLPYYRFYGSKDFDSSATAVFMASSPNGAVVYGDQNWISVYDGSTWNKIYDNSAASSKITALQWDDKGGLYAAGYNSIGRVKLDEDNRLRFVPFSDPEHPLDVRESFQTIKSEGDFVYFQGRRSFASYDKRTGTIDSKVFDTWTTASFFHQGAYHIVTDSNEIFRYENRQFSLAKELTDMAQSLEITIAATAAAPNGDIIMGAERRGLFRFDGQSMQRAYPKFTQYEGHLLRDLKLTSDGRLILAFLGGGVKVIDSDGDLLEDFSGNIDYRFKSARSTLIDPSGSVWAMFNAALAKIMLDAPLSAIDERLRPSLFYASPHLYQGDLYLRSFYILYRAEFDDRGRLQSFRNELPDADIEIWSVAPDEDGMYLGTGADGIFVYSDGNLTHLIDAPAFDRLAVLAKHPQRLVGANSQTVVLYEKTAEGLRILDQKKNPAAFINRMEEDRHGDLWLEYGLGAAGRVRIVDDTLQIDYFDTSHGLPSREWMTLWMHEGEAYFTESAGTRRFDPNTNGFVRVDLIDHLFEGESLRIERAFTDPSGNIWLSANNVNMILWIQPDGSYRRDPRSLSEMGEPYFEFLSFFPDGEALIMTAFELFHYKPKENALARPGLVPRSQIVAIDNLDDSARHFATLGQNVQPAFLRFRYEENSLRFQVASNFSFSTRSPEFQYYLRGFSEGAIPSADSAWSPSSNAYFTNLDAGRYVLMARTRLGNGEITPWAEYPFAIEPPFYRTYFAYSLYLVTGIVIVIVTIDLNSRRLKHQNLKLEQMVAERTQEIETQNLELEKQAEILESQNLELADQAEEIQSNATQLAAALNQLRQAQDQLIGAARTAGRAEVATNVLHNVGNVLNSVNVSLANLGQHLGRSRVENLRKLANLVAEHRHDLAGFVANDPRGKRIPEYLEHLSLALAEEIQGFAGEVRLMDKNVEHIKKIISTQQAHARHVGLNQVFDLGELVDSALAIILGDSSPTAYLIEKRLDPDLSIESDKHRVLEILINLIKNASEALSESHTSEPRLVLAARSSNSDGTIVFEVTDNGVGIDSENLDHLFSHGFTTKADGHGFGLHSCANAAKALGGNLSLSSPGCGKGATATLILPRSPRPAELQRGG